MAIIGSLSAEERVVCWVMTLDFDCDWTGYKKFVVCVAVVVRSYRCLLSDWVSFEVGVGVFVPAKHQSSSELSNAQ